MLSPKARSTRCRVAELTRSALDDGISLHEAFTHFVPMGQGNADAGALHRGIAQLGIEDCTLATAQELILKYGDSTGLSEEKFSAMVRADEPTAPRRWRQQQHASFSTDARSAKRPSIGGAGDRLRRALKRRSSAPRTKGELRPEQLDFSDQNFVDEDLSSLNLCGVSFRNCCLARANLYGSILVGADLRDTDLSECDMRRVDATGASFAGAQLTATRLCRAKLSNACLSRVFALQDGVKGDEEYKERYYSDEVRARREEITKKWDEQFKEDSETFEWSREVKPYSTEEIPVEAFEFTPSEANDYSEEDENDENRWMSWRAECARNKAAAERGQPTECTVLCTGPVDLSHADLSCANMSHAEFTHAHLYCANIESANMEASCFAGADLRQACHQLNKDVDATVCFHATILTEANIIGAELRCSKFLGTDMTYLVGADDDQFRDTEFCSSSFYGADFSYAKLCRFNFEWTRMDKATCFNGADITGARFRGCSFYTFALPNRLSPRLPGDDEDDDDVDSKELDDINTLTSSIVDMQAKLMAAAFMEIGPLWKKAKAVSSSTFEAKLKNEAQRTCRAKLPPPDGELDVAVLRMLNNTIKPALVGFAQDIEKQIKMADPELRDVLVGQFKSIIERKWRRLAQSAAAAIAKQIRATAHLRRAMGSPRDGRRKMSFARVTPETPIIFKDGLITVVSLLGNCFDGEGLIELAGACMAAVGTILLQRVDFNHAQELVDVKKSAQQLLETTSKYIDEDDRLTEAGEELRWEIMERTFFDTSGRGDVATRVEAKIRSNVFKHNMSGTSKFFYNGKWKMLKLVWKTSAIDLASHEQQLRYLSSQMTKVEDSDVNELRWRDFFDSFLSLISLHSHLKAECARQVIEAIFTDEDVLRGLGAAVALRDAENRKCIV